MTNEQLEKASELANAGNKEEALAIFQEIIDGEPDNENAWLWYVDHLTTTDQEKIVVLNQYLVFNPESEKAQQQLANLQNRVAKDTTVTAAGDQLEATSNTAVADPAVSTDRFLDSHPVEIGEAVLPRSQRRRLLIGTVLLATFILFSGLLIWNPGNVTGFVSEPFATLIAYQPPPPPTSTPSLDPIGAIDLSQICVNASDLPPEYDIHAVFGARDTRRLDAYEQDGLVTYHGSEWMADEMPTITCRLMIYEDTEQAEETFEAIQSAFLSSGGPFNVSGRFGQERTTQLVAGVQYVYKYVFREGKVIIQLIMITDGRISLDLMEEILARIENRLKSYDTG